MIVLCIYRASKKEADHSATYYTTVTYGFIRLGHASCFYCFPMDPALLIQFALSRRNRNLLLPWLRGLVVLAAAWLLALGNQQAGALLRLRPIRSFAAEGR